MLKKCCVLLMLIFTLTGCGKQKAPVDRPHTMAVVCGESSIFAMTSGYTWNWKEGKEVKSITAGGEDPRTMMNRFPYLNAGGQTEMTLHFAEKPQEVVVSRWSSADNYAAVETLKTDKAVLEVPQDESSYLYSVTATWSEGGKNWGESTYNFCFLPQGMMASQGSAEIVYTEMAGDLTLTEVLQLKPADLFGVEFMNHTEGGEVKICRTVKDKTAVLDFLQGNLSADMSAVETPPSARYLMRLACVDGRQVTIGCGEAGGSVRVFVGTAAYEADGVDFEALWQQVGAASLSQQTAASGFMAVAEALPDEDWGLDYAYGYVRGLGEELLYDDIRRIEDSEANQGYRLEPGWKDQQRTLSPDCEYWILDGQGGSYGQVSKERLLHWVMDAGYDILFRIYMEDDRVVAICQEQTP